MQTRLKGELFPLLPGLRVDNVLYRFGVGASRTKKSIDAVRAAIQGAVAAGKPLVFPSHFFEYPERAELQALVVSLGAEVFVQVSPGAELSQFFQYIKEELPRNFGVEWILDRAPNEYDRQRIREISYSNRLHRFIFVPTHHVDLVAEMRGLPAEIWPNLYFYFPPKKKPSDANLTPDEIRLFIRATLALEPGIEMRPAHYFRDFEPTAEGAEHSESEPQRDFRFNCDLEFYGGNLSQLGIYPRMRRWIERAPSAVGGVAFLRAILFLLMLLRDPGDLCRSGLRRGYWKAFHLFCELRGKFTRPIYVTYWKAFYLFCEIRDRFVYAMYWKAFHLFCEVRGRFKCFVQVMFWKTLYLMYWKTLHLMYWKAFYLFCVIRDGFIYVMYWKAFHLFCELRGRTTRFAYKFHSPIWTIRTRLPLVYWVFILPFQKAYWFSIFQIRKRILRQNLAGHDVS